LNDSNNILSITGNCRFAKVIIDNLIVESYSYIGFSPSECGLPNHLVVNNLKIDNYLIIEGDFKFAIRNNGNGPDMFRKMKKIKIYSAGRLLNTGWSTDGEFFIFVG